MNFIDISDLNISTDLDVLKRDTQRNSFLLYQHKGDFFADNNRIGNTNQEVAHTKFLKVLEKARQDNIALVLSPEYSCPKSVINLIIDNENMQPPSNKVWVLGGESINKEEIAQLLAVNQDGVFIHCEDVISNTDKSYSDPLYYIFRGVHNGLTKLIVLIQFKTRHMGVWSGDAERNNLIEGNNIYIIKNSNTSIRLMSFICSEAMNVRAGLNQQAKNEILWDDMPFLILHPQINPDPSHQSFVDFRKFILEGEKKELVSLNWGVNTFFNGNNWYSARGNTARSGIFFKTDELNYKNTRVIRNHTKGLYFLHINKNKFVYYFDGIPELFHIENPPVHINQGEAPQRRREGPEVIEIYCFDNATSTFNVIKATNDNHLQFFINRGITNDFLLNADNSILDKERLINISTGKIIGKLENKWCEVIYLNSFKLKEADECNCRMTYVEDTYASSEIIRNLNCSNLIELDNTILPDKSQYPESIKNLAYQNNIILSYSQDASTYKYKYNLTNENGDIQMATVCYLGNVSAKQVNKTYDELQKLFDEGTEGKRRVVVFYRKGTDLCSKYDDTAGSITTSSNDNSSIL
ncbi:hypothetical protein [Xanthomarina gelatinilytica]|uniref:hypothetical protein n=1 Tax=Xanthomarina gelatinilytica TaxID=1137281 RepID=UPI003AA92A6F